MHPLMTSLKKWAYENKLHTTNKFDRSVKRCIRRNLPMDELRKVISILLETGTLPNNYYPHKLKWKKGNIMWECHIQSDWLLIWEQYDKELILLMLDTGTHSDLF